MYQDGKLTLRCEKCYYFFIYNVFETKNISLNSRQSVESDELNIFFRKK